MKVLQGAVRSVVRVADASTAAVGAVGGAAFSGVVGGVKGTAAGVREGVANGSHSMPAAALTLAALGAAGLVEWPLLVTVGGAALVIHQLAEQKRHQTPQAPAVAPTPLRSATARSTEAGNGSRPRARKSSGRRATKAPSA
ncbi:MAG TPA: hypothetical protein VMU34_06315 [Mycobacterium sp.]|nr:hypothetical protein [Mycobacterium sp.]